MATKKEIQIILMERDRVVDSIQALEERYRSNQISKTEYHLLRERYDDKLKEIEQKLGVKKAEKKPRKLGLRFWRKKSS